jgi:alpha-L-fucosidase
MIGEGPTQIRAGAFGEEKSPDFTARDIRFTSRWKTLYAIVLDWPENSPELVIKSLNTNDARLAQGQIANVFLLGSDAKLSWLHNAEGLKITLPPEKPGDFACVFKIRLN